MVSSSSEFVVRRITDFSIETRRYLEAKIEDCEIFFIACCAETYVAKGVYNFVDFRVKRAGSSNYRGASFAPGANDASNAKF